MSLAALKSKLNNRKAESAAKKAQYIRTTKLNPGKNRVRILPSWRKKEDGSIDMDGDFFHDFGMHFVKDKESKIAAVYVCTDRTYAKDCAVCQAVYEGIRLAKESGNTGMEKLLGQARASHRILVNALMRDSAEPNKPVILELPGGVFEQQMIDQIIAFADEGVSVIDPNEGHDFIITKSGSGIDTEYSVALAPKATAVTYDESLVTDLDAYCSQESEQGLLKAVRATTAVTGLPSPALALSGPSEGAKATGTEGAFITPPAASAAPAAAVATGSVISAAAAAADEAEEELDALEGELEDAPWEEVSEPAAPADTATATAPADDLADAISADDDDLDSILDGLDDL